MTKAEQDRKRVEMAYVAAYRLANNGRYVSCDYFGGWYTVYTAGLTQSKYRRSEIVAMTQELLSRASKSAAA